MPAALMASVTRMRALRPFGAPPEPHDLGLVVDAVADHFGKERVVGEHGAENSGLAVVQRAHGVEGVRGADGAGVDGGARFGGGGVGVAQGHAHAAASGVGREFDRAG